MKKVYADNGSTSFPKAPGISDMLTDFLENNAVNINRGGYSSSYDTSMKVLETKELISEFFNFNKSKNIVFTPSITYSLNFLIKGFLKDGEHVIVTSMEHNAVMRPLNQVLKEGDGYTRIICDKEGNLNPKDIISSIKRNTKAVIMTHASNVCGTIMPIYEVADICKKYNLKFIVDSAQTAGIIDIDFENIDALAFTGHKGLLGLQGIGGFLIKDNFCDEITPIITGGTGSASHEEIQPDYMPDKFESGTLNIPGILSLNKSIKYINKIGIKNIYDKEMELTNLFLEGVSKLKDVRVVGRNDCRNRTPVVALDFTKMDNSFVSMTLDNDYKIMTRCGLHCAPSAHKTLNTFPKGVVRFSFSHFNTYDEINYILDCLKSVTEGDINGF